jgi:hypothetical protein
VYFFSLRDSAKYPQAMEHTKQKTKYLLAAMMRPESLLSYPDVKIAPRFKVQYPGI